MYNSSTTFNLIYSTCWSVIFEDIIAILSLTVLADNGILLFKMVASFFKSGKRFLDAFIKQLLMFYKRFFSLNDLLVHYEARNVKGICRL